MRTAFLFPGQGAHSPHFLRSLSDSSVVHETLTKSSECLNLDVNDLDSEASLRSSVAVQLTTLVAGVAYARHLASAGARPDVVAGLSVGAFAAAVTSGVLPFEAALRLVRLRAETMERQFGGGGYGMTAVLGLNEIAVQRIVEGVARSGAALHLACVNAPSEIVIGGSATALSAAGREAERAGARVRRLNVGVPSHGHLLESVSVALREAMRSVLLAEPVIPYVSNVRARLLTDRAAIAEDLILNVSHPVRWHDSIVLLHELGTELFVETPPGSALSMLARTQLSGVRVVAAVESTPESIAYLVRENVR